MQPWNLTLSQFGVMTATDIVQANQAEKRMTISRSVFLTLTRSSVCGKVLMEACEKSELFKNLVRCFTGRPCLLYASPYCAVDCGASRICNHRELVVINPISIQNTRVAPPPCPCRLRRHPGVRVAGVEIHARATRGPCCTESCHGTERLIVVACAGVAFWSARTASRQKTSCEL
jgi:hypothetical protein